MTLPSRPEVVTGEATASRTGQESAPTAAGAPPRVAHHLRAWLGGLAVAVLVLLAEATGVLRGPLSVVVMVVLLIALPTAKEFSHRLAMNGTILLGAIPMLWWMPWLVGGPSHFGVITAVAAGILAGVILRSAPARRRLLPTFSLPDLVPAVAGAFSIWFFWPFGAFRDGLGGLAMLMQGFGHDNVAHFDMVQMIRQTATTGALWPASPDGSEFAYVNYPQHFQVLAAMISEGWAGPATSAGSDVWLYGFATGIALTIALVTVVAAITLIPGLRRRAGLQLVIAAVIGYIAFVGLGGSSLNSGFPNYLLSILGVVLATVLGHGVRHPRIGDVVASASAVILVAHTWILLMPIALVAYVAVVWRLPWRAASRRQIMAVAAASVALLAAIAFGGVLVLRATEASGSAAAALSTPGGTPSVPLSFGVGFGVLGMLVGIAVILLARPRGVWGILKEPSTGVVLAIAVAGLEASALIYIQVQQTGALSYFQNKFIYAIAILFLIEVVILACAIVGSTKFRLTGWWARGATTVFLAAGLVVILGFSGTVSGKTESQAIRYFPGFAFRNNLGEQALAPDEATIRLGEAAQIMATRPCARPLYIAALLTDKKIEAPNSWAMSLSSTWTEAASGINTYLWGHPILGDVVATADVIEELLSEDPQRCVVISPEARELLPAPQLDRDGDRILSWDRP